MNERNSKKILSLNIDATEAKGQRGTQDGSMLKDLENYGCCLFNDIPHSIRFSSDSLAIAWIMIKT